MITIRVDTTQIEARLTTMAERIPDALKGAVNAMAKDVWRTTRAEMQTIFDRPTPRTLAAFSITKWATREDPSAQLDFNRYYQGAIDNPIANTLRPHIPGFSNLRARKGAEIWLTNAGFMRADEYLVPSRTCPLDRYGNVRGPYMQQMLADVGAYRNAPGFDATSRRPRHIFGEVRGRNGRLVKGIWKVQGGAARAATNRWQLMMLVVRRAPLYRKRFDLDTIAQREISAKLQGYIDQYIRTILR